MSVEMMGVERLKRTAVGGCQGCPFAGNCAPCRPRAEVSSPKVESSVLKAFGGNIYAETGNIYASGMLEARMNASLTEVTCKSCGEKYRPKHEFDGCPHCKGKKDD